MQMNQQSQISEINETLANLKDQNSLLKNLSRDLTISVIEGLGIAGQLDDT
jgi:hypothetical protein